ARVGLLPEPRPGAELVPGQLPHGVTAVGQRGPVAEAPPRSGPEQETRGEAVQLGGVVEDLLAEDAVFGPIDRRADPAGEQEELDQISQLVAGGAAEDRDPHRIWKRPVPGREGSVEAGERLRGGVIE